MAKVTFDGITKTIDINATEDTIDVQIDLYSDWKEWVLLSDNAKYEQAFRTFGGDPTNQTETQFAPRYFFLINNWQVAASSISVDVQLNLYTDNFSTPFIINNAAVNSRNSDAQVIKSEIENVLSYNGVVYIDTGVTTSGTSYPFGTSAFPVNNLYDGMIISDDLGIHTFFITTPTDGCLVFDIDIPNHKFVGDVFPPNISFHDVDMSGSTFDRLILTGTMSATTDKILLLNCFCGNNNPPCGIGDLVNFNGNAENCNISANLYLSPGFDGILSNCNSTHAGGIHSNIFIQGTQSVDLNIINWNGELGLHGMTQSGSVATIEVDPGKVDLHDDNTDGTIIIRGVGVLENSATGSCTVITQGFTGDIHDSLENMEPELFRIGVVVDNLTGSTNSQIYDLLTQVAGTVSLIYDDTTYITTQIDLVVAYSIELLGLVHKNYRAFDQIYDGDGNLTDATIRTYPTSGDLLADTNHNYEYSISATYDIDGRITDYRVST